MNLRERLNRDWSRGRALYEAAGRPENGWDWEDVATRVQEDWMIRAACEGEDDGA